jgi:hypothetical protein
MSRPARPGLFAVLLALSLGVALPALATYVIYTKDGKRIDARDQPTVQGKRLVYVTPLGTPQSILVEDWDKERSEKANKLGLGNAYVLDEPTNSTAALPAPETKKPSLSEYIRQYGRKNVDAERPESVQGALVKIRQTESESRAPSRAAAPDPASMVMDPQITDAFMRALDGSSVKGVKLTQIPSGVRVQATTESEQQVFLALVACARGLKESRATGKPLDKAEIVFSTGSGENAGRFDLSPNDAENLLNGRVTPARYFVSNVLF